MKYFSMFSGIGGFELGIGELGECVGYSEIDEHAIKTYKEHFEHENFGNATTINPADLPDFDLLVGGFPCQAFSVAGKRRGFDETRGILFFDIARILAYKKPRHLVLENVKGLLSHNGGATFQTIAGVLSDLGYGIEWQVLNSKDFGVPQNRERIYIVGHLGGGGRRKIFPLVRPDGADNPQRVVSAALDSNYFKGIDNHGQRTAIRVSGILDTPTWRKRHEQIRRVHDPSGLSPTIPTGTGGGVMTKIEIRPVLTPDRAEMRQNGRRFKDDGEPSFTFTGQDKHGIMITEATKKGYAEAHDGDSVNLSQPNSKTRRGRVGHKVANTLDTGVQQGVVANTRIRRLTPMECERLQGFPDGWTVGSDTQRYKQCGNAVTVNVVHAVMEELFK